MHESDKRATDLAALIRKTVPGATAIARPAGSGRGAKVDAWAGGHEISIISDGYGKHSGLWEAWIPTAQPEPVGWLDPSEVCTYIRDTTHHTEREDTTP